MFREVISTLQWKIQDTLRSIYYAACKNDDTSLNIYIFVIALMIRSLGDYQELGMLFGWAFLASSNEIHRSHFVQLSLAYLQQVSQETGSTTLHFSVKNHSTQMLTIIRLLLLRMCVCISLFTTRISIDNCLAKNTWVSFHYPYYVRVCMGFFSQVLEENEAHHVTKVTRVCVS